MSYNNNTHKQEENRIIPADDALFSFAEKQVKEHNNGSLVTPVYNNSVSSKVITDKERMKG